MLVIFDFDGTLADTWDLLANELVANAGQLHYKQLSRGEIEDLRRLQTKEVFRALGVPWWRLPRVVSHLRRRAEALADRIELFPGIHDLVTTLGADGHTLAVVSSNSEATVREVLGRDLVACIRFFACNSSVFGKASKFRRLRRRAGVPAFETIAIGDETRDLHAAQAAGIAAIAVEWGYNDPELLRTLAPGRTAASIGALRDMLMQFSGSGRLR